MTSPEPSSAEPLSVEPSSAEDSCVESSPAAVARRRSLRLARYAELRAERPELFHNPPDAAYEILFDPADQEAVAERAAAALRAVGKPAEYGDIGVVYEDPYVIVVRDAVRMRDGTHTPFVRLMGARPGPNAVVLPLLADGRVLLVRHFRHEPRGWRWEIPRGFAEPGADGAATARQELWEETGAQAQEIRLLGRLGTAAGTDEIYLAELPPGWPPMSPRVSSTAAPSSAGSASAAVTFAADAMPSIALPPAGAVLEGIDEVCAVTTADLARLIANGEIVDGYLLAAYAFAVTRGLLPVPSTAGPGA